MNTKLLTVLLLISMCNQVFAQKFIDSENYQTLKTYIDQQNHPQAWQLAQQEANEYLGDAHFDFFYGLAALNIGEIERAGFAFERVVVNQPNWLDGQYYLAMSYFKMANYQAAIELCQTIMTQSTADNKLKLSSQKLKQAAQTKLAQQSLSVKHDLSLTGGYDSNINAGINEDDIYLPFIGQRIALTAESQEQSDAYLTGNYRLKISKPLSQNSKLLMSGQANVHSFINKHDFNRIGLSGSLGYQKSFKQFDTSISIQTRPLWLAGNYYRNQTNINGKIIKQLNDQWRISTTLSRGKTVNDVNSELDTDDTSLSFSNSYDIDNFRHSLSISYFEEMTGDNTSAHISRKSTALSYNNIWIINPQWLASGTILWQHKKYQGLHPFYFTKQVDNMWLLSSMVQYSHSKMLSYRFNITAQDKNSNLSLFSYQRFDIGLTAIINF